LKRIGGLHESIGTWENLRFALWRAARGRRTSPEVAGFLAGAPERLERLRRALAQESVTFGPYRPFVVRDTKRRDIMAPPFEQRVLHHAMLRVLGPMLERSATDRSFASRPGRGPQLALQLARSFARRGDWYLKLDVRRFYDSLRHADLMVLLSSRFRERRLLRLLARLLDSHHVRPGCGLPIGALTSQYLGNFFLDGLDHRVLSGARGRRYLRYMDDMIVWGGRGELLDVRETVVQWLADRGLEPKHGGELHRADTGAPWLGFVVYPGRVRLSAAARRRLARRTKAVRRIEDETERRSRLTAQFAWAGQADDLAWRRAMLRRQGEFGEVQGQRAGAPRRLVEQPGGQRHLGLPQQGAAR
jgi:RNA-directed DNA polymerase